MVTLKKEILALFCVCCLISCKNLYPQKPEANQAHIVVFSKTLGYRHASIELGIESIKKLGIENHFLVDATEDSKVLTSNLKKYDAVVFLSPSGDIFNDAEQELFKNYIKNGGGFVGIHGATTAEYDWPWFGKFIGAYFDEHPKQQNATINVINHNHLATSFLDATWNTFDEWYNFKNLSANFHVLMMLDETSYIGGKHGENHPIAWYHNNEGGRMFYTALGHGDISYKDPLFLKHILGGIRYAIKKTE
jgi:type 1 glutamine amidotransferase